MHPLEIPSPLLSLSLRLMLMGKNVTWLALALLCRTSPLPQLTQMMCLTPLISRAYLRSRRGGESETLSHHDSQCRRVFRAARGQHNDCRER